MTSRFEQLFDIWSGQIPLVGAMQVSLHEQDGEWHLHAPLAPNQNHMGTGFGGSIASLATLAGWAQTWMLLPDPDAVHIVVARSDIRYMKPATSELIATAETPAQQHVSRFVDRLALHGQASLTLTTHVHSNAVAAATLFGKFVATARQSTGYPSDQ